MSIALSPIGSTITTPPHFDQSARDYERIVAALTFIEKRFPERPALPEIARATGLSESHFQRLFSRWVGISPQKFIQFLSKEYATQVLTESRSLLDATFDAGLSSPGRLHDLIVTCEAVTPGELRTKGRGLNIEYGIHPTPFGDCLLATTERGICFLAFRPDSDPDHSDALDQMHATWENANIRENPGSTAPIIHRIFSDERTSKLQNASESKTGNPNTKPITLLLKGTNFQIKVWEALMRVPPGRIVSYEDIARMSGNDRAVRAVAGAVAANPISYVIPCHRVIRKMGIIHNYRWGPVRKKALLAWEAAQFENDRNAVASR